jgi:hypothetical protein
MDFRTRAQLAEALGPVNRWFCSEKMGQPVDRHEVLVTHYIKHGGAADFARRYREAMSKDNRWFCSIHHGREVCDAERLWDYYCRATRAERSGPKT